MLAFRTVPTLLRGLPSSSVTSFTIDGRPTIGSSTGSGVGALVGTGVAVGAGGNVNASSDFALPVYLSESSLAVTFT